MVTSKEHITYFAVILLGVQSARGCGILPSMKAKLSEKFVVFFFDASALVLDESKLLLDVIAQDGATVLTGIGFTAGYVVPNLLVTPELLLDATGKFVLRYTYDSNLLLLDTLEVSVSPVSDVVVGRPSDVALYADVVGNSGETISVRVIDKAGNSTDLVSAPYLTYPNSYVAALPALALGHYALVWYRATESGLTLLSSSALLVSTRTGREPVLFTLANPVSPTAEGISGAMLVVYDASESTIGRGTTDAAGMVQLEIPPGEYKVAAFKSNCVFTHNNFAVAVLNSAISGHANRFILSTTVFSPNTAVPTFGSTTTLYMYLRNMLGRPYINVDVQFGLLHRPEVFDGVGVFDTQQSCKTDQAGYAEITLVQGIQVEVWIAPVGLRRIITVPVSSTPVNLLTLLSGLDDLFDIQRPVIPAAYKRSL